MERECNECGSSDWNKLLEEQYPERRSKDRDKTTKEVFVCNECGAEGRRFEDGHSGGIQHSGAAR